MPVPAKRVEALERGGEVFVGGGRAVAGFDGADAAHRTLAGGLGRVGGAVV